MYKLASCGCMTRCYMITVHLYKPSMVECSVITTLVSYCVSNTFFWLLHKQGTGSHRCKLHQPMSCLNPYMPGSFKGANTSKNVHTLYHYTVYTVQKRECWAWITFFAYMRHWTSSLYWKWCMLVCKLAGWFLSTE